MAITNAQQYKQLMQNGGRIGLRGGGADMGAEDKAQDRADKGYGDTSGPDRSRTSDRQDYNTAIATGKNPLGLDLGKGPPDLTPREKEFNKQNNLSLGEKDSAMWAFWTNGPEFQAKTEMPLGDEDKEKLILVIEAIKEHEDVKNIYSNASL